ncbi:nitric oxide synthase oxygenase [Kibdelosporangium phytohabitans]|uniref:Nitric oxide synthase (NOS) domain-containing protein n=1 Tax=Kibdelosporangium phytohabitans TaxID=860235 RepID=A0A0N9HW84_9PSEU|nr:nitric oxide synthase oxygenase [Kibdelosporangium phytohabitans]ALG06396.1 hypothetical protein AOZ06_05175 [Kibdelosporangium phytohabitans]MBE1467547.1 nitric-oxide synthase [Kibdelosporangium phytohabitans]
MDATVLAEAEDFLSVQELGGLTLGRKSAVRDAILHHGTYTHTTSELEWGARLAWRNTIACIGRPYWRALQVRDQRDVDTPDQLAEACIEHLRAATNRGHIRLLLTAFAPASLDRPPIRILNAQLVQYAGYRGPGGTVTGDPKNLALTDLALAVGWTGATGGSFDVLPLVIHQAGGQPRCYPLPTDAVLEVVLRHPRLPWFEDLGLRWYAHPAISDQRLRIGGVDYPAAPFSGWYTCTEISARNLADPHRYNVLPALAERIGLDIHTSRTLWRDRALVELTEAVMHSYTTDGIVLVDHHFAATSFAHHEDRERAAGREVYGSWRALIAPTAASTTDLYHRHYTEHILLPNFFPQPFSPTEHNDWLGQAN